MIMVKKMGWDTRIIGSTNSDCHKKKKGMGRVGKFHLLWQNVKVPTPIDYHSRVL